MKDWRVALAEGMETWPAGEANERKTIERSGLLWLKTITVVSRGQIGYIIYFGNVDVVLPSADMKEAF